MDKIKLDKLKEGLGDIKIKTFELKRAKNQKERSSIQSDITFFTDKLIQDFNLIQYDMGIMEEKHKTGFFIYDVENIIKAIEEKNIDE